MNATRCTKDTYAMRFRRRKPPVKHEEDDRSRPGRAWDYAEVSILTKNLRRRQRLLCGVEFRPKKIEFLGEGLLAFKGEHATTYTLTVYRNLGAATVIPQGF